MLNSPDPKTAINGPRPIRKMGDSVLRQPCEAVSDFRSVQAVLECMCSTLDSVKRLYNFKRGAGISAPQIGESLRISIIDFDDHRHALINPEVVDKSQETITVSEGCLSFFDHRGMVERAKWIRVRAFDGNGREFFLEGEGNLASLLQHEMDHLDGILYVDRLPGKEADLRKLEGMPAIP